MIFYAEAAGLDCPSEIVTGARDDISHPGRPHLPHASAADHLIKQYVGNRSDKREIFFVLPDNLMGSGERYQRFKRKTHGYRTAIGDKTLDGFGKS